jgi:hypothetical protein
VSRSYRKILRNHKQRIQRRLAPRNWEDQPEPMLKASNIHYEVAEKTQAISYGGIGAIHKMIGKLGLAGEIDRELELLKKHLPYHESDHVINLAYNALVGGMRLEDIELRRNDEVFLDALGAQRIPDPTTSGDFTRRLSEEQILVLMECINRIREKVWGLQKRKFLREAIIDADGLIARTLGECKQGMDISYKGIWGYHPLLISLANTREVLYLVNRPGNVASHQGAAEWIDRAVALVKKRARKVLLRGDTDFSLTAHFDRWAKEVDFIFGIDANTALVRIAQNLAESRWAELVRRPKYTIKTRERCKPQNVKERIVKAREFKNLRLESEQIAEFFYRPGHCHRDFRVVVVRKNITVEKGEVALFDEIRYFFYITTKMKISARKVVALANQRCDQENVIEQLKNGVNAMRMPVDNLLSNWAYMVMTSLAWNLKAWFAMLMPKKARWEEVLRMEFRRFLHAFIIVPCQIIRTGRRIVYRLLGCNSWTKEFLATFEHLCELPAQ